MSNSPITSKEGQLLKVKILENYVKENLVGNCHLCPNMKGIYLASCKHLCPSIKKSNSSAVDINHNLNKVNIIIALILE